MYKFILPTLLVTVSFNALSGDEAMDNCKFQKLDVNSDNLISHEEALGNKELTKFWGELDIDQDGYLNNTECAQASKTVSKEQKRETSHPQDVQQYDKSGQYLEPDKQIQRNDN